jgi:hypothetical protein
MVGPVALKPYQGSSNPPPVKSQPTATKPTTNNTPNNSVPKPAFASLSAPPQKASQPNGASTKPATTSTATDKAKAAINPLSSSVPQKANKPAGAASRVDTPFSVSGTWPTRVSNSSQQQPQLQLKSHASVQPGATSKDKATGRPDPLFGQGSTQVADGYGSQLRATPKQIAEIKKAINEEKYVEATNLTIKAYAVDISRVKSIKYDPTLEGNGRTKEDRSVKIGKPAFSSPGWLASTIGHEVIHTRQAKDRWYGGKVGTNLNEVECYDWEIRNSSKHGLTGSEIKKLIEARNVYYQNMPKDIQSRADKGNYYMPKGRDSE